jgi:phosphatidylethanolamine-binding protein (PEBP) family uncharacterized protein
VLRARWWISALVFVVVGCSGDGRTMRVAGPDQTQSIAIPTTSAAPVGFSMTTPWVTGTAIDPRHTCLGESVAPRIEFSYIPADIASIGLVLVDETSGGTVLWVVANVDPTSPVIDEGALPTGAITGLLPSGVLGYEAPCPADGALHTYRLIGYALPQQVEWDTGTDAQTIVDTLEAAALDVTSSYFTAP